MSNQAVQSSGLRALYEMHVERLDGIRSGAAQRVYSEEEIEAFRNEAARLKAMLDAIGPQSADQPMRKRLG